MQDAANTTFHQGGIETCLRILALAGTCTSGFVPRLPAFANLLPSLALRLNSRILRLRALYRKMSLASSKKTLQNTSNNRVSYELLAASRWMDGCYRDPPPPSTTNTSAPTAYLDSVDVCCAVGCLTLPFGAFPLIARCWKALTRRRVSIEPDCKRGSEISDRVDAEQVARAHHPAGLRWRRDVVMRAQDATSLLSFEPTDTYTRLMDG